MRLQEGICVLGAWYLVCHDLVSCYFALFYCLLDMRGGECDVYALCCSVNGSVGFVCCLCDTICEYLVKQFAICLGVFDILLLNVME